MISSYLDSFDTEYSRRLVGLTRPDPHAMELWKKVLSSFHNKDLPKLHDTYEYARSIPYDHKGLSPEIYFSHVLRVSALAGLLSSCRNVDTVQIGLLHNALEVGHITPLELARNSSPEIASAIELLTVDRSQQWDSDYKKNYYENLNRASESVRYVKVIDKLDNIFLLHRNPDTETKRKYRDELTKYVLPLAKTCNQELFQYMQELMQFSLKHEG